MVNDLLNGTRRDVILGAGAVAILGATTGACATRQEIQMATFTTRDDVTIYYKDWGPRDGEVVILSHGWPLNADSWESQAFHLASNGYRVITHDRRGHGRSSQPWDGNDMDHYADDLAQLIEQLDLRNVSLFGFSTGGGEVARYVGRHGTSRVARIGLISAVPPIMLRTEAQSDRPAHRGVRRLPRRQHRQPLEALSRHRERPVLRLQPARRHARPGPRRELLAAGNDGRAQEHLRQHRRLLGDRLHPGPRTLRQADARHPRRRRSGRADRCLGAVGEAPRCRARS